jgi:exosortase
MSADSIQLPPQALPAATDSVVPQPKGESLSAVAAVGAAVLCALFLGSESKSLSWMYNVWTTNPDNSHGLLVPFFAIALLWTRRAMRPSENSRVSWVAFSLGALLICGATAMICFSIYARVNVVGGASVVPFAAGICLCYGGWAGARWAWPSVLFLVFMVPLPKQIGTQLGSTLQHVATISSTFLMQLLGMPAVAEGNVIFLTHNSLGVAEACSGIRMLMSFFALTTALCFMVERAAWEKALIWISAPVIAVVANVLRITATGIAYEFGSERLAELIFHDLAGWLMMPVGLLLLWIELFLLARLFPVDDDEDASLSQRGARN